MFGGVRKGEEMEEKRQARLHHFEVDVGLGGVLFEDEVQNLLVEDTHTSFEFIEFHFRGVEVVALHDDRGYRLAAEDVPQHVHRGAAHPLRDHIEVQLVED